MKILRRTFIKLAAGTGVSTLAVGGIGFPKGLSIRSLGFVGDGRSDETVALKNALALAADLKWPLVIPPGFKIGISEPIQIGVSIHADGAGIFALSESARLEVRDYHGSGLTIRGLEFNGRSVATGLFVEDSSRVTIENCRFTACSAFAIKSVRTSRLAVAGSLLGVNGNALGRPEGIALSESAQATFRKNQIVLKSGGIGLRGTGGTSLLFQDNELSLWDDSSSSGSSFVLLDRPEGGRIESNRFRTNLLSDAPLRPTIAVLDNAGGRGIHCISNLYEYGLSLTGRDGEVA